MIDLIIILILLLILGGAGLYVYRAKKAGQKCIGRKNSCGNKGINKSDKSACMAAGNCNTL